MGTRHWKAGVTAEEFKKLRPDPRLPRLLALARVANALSLAHHGMIMSLRWQNPRSVKVRTAAILYAASVLHEGLIVAESLPKHFRDLQQYKAGFGPILADPDVVALRARFLKPLRDQSVFHFDRKVFEKALARADITDNVVLLSGGEPNAAGVYYNFADDLTSHYLVDEFSDEGKFIADLEVFMVGTSRLFTRYTIAAQRLLAAAFRELGARRLRPKRVSRSAP